MKLLFVHDHKFYRQGGIFYSDNLPYSVFEKYLGVFDSMTVFSRFHNQNMEFEGKAISSGENVSFISAEDIGNLKSFIRIRNLERKKLALAVRSHDAVVVRLPSEYGLMAVKLAKELNKPLLIEVVACAWESLWNYGKISASLYAPYAFYKTRKAVKSAHYISYVSKVFLQKRYPSFGVSIGISDVELPCFDESLLEARLKKIKDHKKAINIGMIGSFKNRYKGVHDAIQALSLVVKWMPNVSLRILGSGNLSYYKDMVNSLNLEEKVHFDGVLPSGSAVFKWLDNIDLYIQPSLTEGMPRALLEAFSRACPALTSTAGGMPEVMEVDCTFEPGDYKSLAILIRKSLTDSLWLMRQAERNFFLSAEYSKSNLNERRSKFLNEFSDFVKCRN